MTNERSSPKHPSFVIRQADPFNGGPNLEHLAASPTTPNEHFFVRSHGTVPVIDATAFRLRVRGVASTDLWLSQQDLRDGYERVEVEATLQCAGNRRQELMAARAIPNEVAWGPEAISHGRWAGVRVRDVLARVGMTDGGRSGHLVMESADAVEREGKRFGFGGSIPLERALHPSVILADEMNGQPLPAHHGFPLRVVAPGYIGARSVKWVTALSVQDSPSDNYFQARAYRLAPPFAEGDPGMMLGEFSLTSVICTPEDGATLPAGSVTLRGYAYAGGDRTIDRVDLSQDGGVTWRRAELEGVPHIGSWRLWHATVRLDVGDHRLCVRAIDTAGNSQPELIESVWNAKGYVNNAWHRISVQTP